MTHHSHAAVSAFELTPEWKEKIQNTAPATPTAPPQQDRKVLIFSLNTGFKHWCIPHTTAVVEILGATTGAYSTTESTDIEVFRPETLKQYDAIVLNNNCPDRKDRDLFRDVLIHKMDEYGAKYASMPLEERTALADQLYRNLIDYVETGGGLVLLHGAITNFMYSDEFSGMVGGSFDFHPQQQDVTLIPASPGHPMLKPFHGKPFTHFDEPYFMNRAYADLDFHPLLEMDVSKLKPDKKNRIEALPDLPRYVAWIKPYQQGRVFFCSPSHNAQSFERPELLGFILNGMQYALGDLACDDATPPRSTQTK